MAASTREEFFLNPSAADDHDDVVVLQQQQQRVLPPAEEGGDYGNDSSSGNGAAHLLEEEHATVDDNEDEDFEDACEIIPHGIIWTRDTLEILTMDVTSTLQAFTYDSDDEGTLLSTKEIAEQLSEMDLSTSIGDAKIALNLFLDNRFAEAKQRMKPWIEKSMYHSLSHSTIMFLQAVLTFERPAIDAAIASVKKSINLCQSRRKKHSVMQSIKKISQKPDYSSYTDVEIHAELCFAECLLQRALLSFIQDENLLSFLKGAFKIKSCYQSYKECEKILEARKGDIEEFDHFKSGVNMGIGAFNLMISQLPGRVLKLLEFVGFSGNRKLGLNELMVGSSNVYALRGPLCSLILLGYHTLVTHILGTADGDITIAEKINEPCLKSHPKSALFLFFAGRIEEIKGNTEQAIKGLSESVDSQSEWKQFHHLCYWELMWCYSFKCDWPFAMKYAERLAVENRWSKATYIYLKGSFLALCDSSDKTKQKVEGLYSEVPGAVQRIAGKSLPIEKFALKKVKLYKAQGNRLTLAALEMIYVWNGFSIIGQRPELLDKMAQLVEEAINKLVSSKDEYQYYYDNYSLALLLKGVCLGYKGQAFQADMCFQEIIDNSKELVFDTYLAPWAMVEQGLLRIKLSEFNEARQRLESAKSNYKGYALESRLHFKIHAANVTISQALKGADNSSNS